MRGYDSADVDPPPMVSLCLSATCEGDYNVSGAGGVGHWCNGIYYRNNNTYDGKPSFSQIGGECMIYHLQQWKITWELQTSGWYYMAEGDPKPPEGKWLNIPCVACAGGSQAVRACENREICDYVVSGATGSLEATQCNGQYRQDGRWNGKPLYKQTSGKKSCYIFYFITWETGFYLNLPATGWYTYPPEDTPPLGQWEPERLKVAGPATDVVQVSLCQSWHSMVVLPSVAVVIAAVAICGISLTSLRNVQRAQLQKDE